MSSSLRDQLVKAGLATASQAKKAERAQESKRRGAQSGGARSGAKSGAKSGSKGQSKNARPEVDASPEGVAKARARQVQAEKAGRDRAIAKLRNEKAAEKAKRAEIKQLIAQNDVRPTAASDDDAPYNFVHGKKVKRIYLPKPQVEELSAGRLVIVNNDGRYHIVNQAAANKIRERDPKWIVAAHAQGTKSEEPVDDFYQQFEVPDDLDW